MMMSKYVVTDNDVKVQILQDGLDKFKKWSKIWQLDLSFHKCAVLHISNDIRKNSVIIIHIQLVV